MPDFYWEKYYGGRKQEKKNVAMVCGMGLALSHDRHEYRPDGAVVWFILTETNRYGRKMHFCVTVFRYFEAAVHFLLADQSMTAFYAEGIYTGFYAPGLVTALCCWLPLGIAGTVWFVKNKVHWKDVVGGLMILAVFTLIFVKMPEQLLKSENSPYSFDNAGWYEQYIVQGFE